MFGWVRDLLSRRRWPDPAAHPLVDRVPFAQRLSETQRWCSMPGRLDPRTSLRSHQLMPWILHSDPFTIVSFIARQRRHRLDDRDGGGPYRDAAPSRDGQLLVHYPGLNLVDGAAEEMSEGFFDMWNLPPWDTWIAFGSQPTTARDRCLTDFLISWVPAQLVELADRGIDANPEQCIAWLDPGRLPGMLAAAGMP
jgi:hypothetical protein